MLKSYMKYGCAATKVRAMYGRRLTENEWEKLYEAETPGRILDILREAKSWQYALSLIPSGSAGVHEITLAVRNQVRYEREKLINYVLGDDKELLSLFIREDEYRLILNALRRLKNGAFGTRREVSELLGRKSRVDFTAMLNAKNYSELLRAAEKSIYYRPLASLPLDHTGYPEYSPAAIALENTYYLALHKIITKKHSGVLGQKLNELIGAEADILNILSILRILRHFPASAGDFNSIIIPVHRRLGQDLIGALSLSGSEAAAVVILKASYWHDLFEDYNPRNLDRMFDGALEALYRKYLRDSDPGLACVIAYLNLKKAEGDRLIRIITSAHYNMQIKKVSI